MYNHTDSPIKKTPTVGMQRQMRKAFVGVKHQGLRVDMAENRSTQSAESWVGRKDSANGKTSNKMPFWPIWRWGP